MRQLGIGILGFGTVGAGVVEGLQRDAALLRERLGIELVLRGVADIDLETDRGLKIDRSLLSDDAAALIADPSIDVVVELIGGCGVAKELMRAALEAGKPVVTANKKLLAEHGLEMVELAAARGVDLFFGGSVGGGIPIVRALREGLVGCAVHGISGIVNGTCNYILTRMEREALAFDDALRDAQQAGYAEADPSLDIDGFDTAHKAAILAWLAYGSHVPMSAVSVEGIRGLSPMDVSFAGDLGYRIKLLALVKRDGEDFEVRVQPALVPRSHMLASVNDVYNAVMVHCGSAGDTLYYGRGAGRYPTASTVIADISDAALNLAAGGPRRPRAVPRAEHPLRLRPVEETLSRYYLRLSVLDRAGSLGRIAAVLGEHGVSIASVMQKAAKQEDRFVPVVVLTHEASEASLRGALRSIEALEVINEPPVRFAVEG